ncbi:hypothetical protein ABPG75_010177 [Micractinium tetrahymenae]
MKLCSVFTVVAACTTGQRWSLAAVAAGQGPFTLQVPEDGIVGTYYRTVIRDGPQPQHSVLWGDDIIDGTAASIGIGIGGSEAAAGTCTAAAAAHTARMLAQTELLISGRVYKPREDADEATPRAAWCRSDAPAATPLPLLRSISNLRNRKAHPPAAEGITLVTQLSLERLPMLERQCRVWAGYPLAAAVYIPLIQGKVASGDDPRLNGSSLDAALVPLLKLHAAAEAGTGCILDVEIVTEAHCDAASAALYPTNAVRNRALRLVGTEAVLLLDVDFLPSSSLLERAADARHRAALMALLQQPVALVLPAFETAGKKRADAELAARVVTAGKEAVLSALDSGALHPFHSGHYTRGHLPTDFRRWAVQTQPYNCTFTRGFEPYILLHRARVPWYDERFRGYFINKLAHAAHLHYLGTRFLVHPDAFVVHQPHKTAASKGQARAQGLNHMYTRLFSRALGQMQVGNYLPYVADPHLCYTSRLWD